MVDWPHKAESKSYFPPKGYAFLLFQVRDEQAMRGVCFGANSLFCFFPRSFVLAGVKEESSVQQLIESCIQEDDKLYLCVSSPTIKVKRKRPIHSRFAFCVTD